MRPAFKLQLYCVLPVSSESCKSSLGNGIMIALRVWGGGGTKCVVQAAALGELVFGVQYIAQDHVRH